MSFFSGSKFVKELSPKDFDGVATWKLKNKGCSVILFYCDWCPHCRAIKDTWEQLGKTVLFMDILAYDCVKNGEHLDKIREDMPELVKGYPTIIFYSKGQPAERFAGDRTYGNLLEMCKRTCQTKF